MDFIDIDSFLDSYLMEKELDFYEKFDLLSFNHKYETALANIESDLYDSLQTQELCQNWSK